MFTENTPPYASGSNATQFPNATAPTTPPANTFVDVKHALANGMLLYYPETNGFIALWPEEWLAIRKEAEEHNTLIEKLQEANRAVTEAAVKLREAHKSGTKGDIAAADKVLEQKLTDQRKAGKAARTAIKPLGDLKTGDPLKMVELLPLTMKTKSKSYKPIYVKSDKIKQALKDKRIYLVEGEKEKRAQKKLIDGGKLDTHELKQRIADQVQDKAGFHKKWKFAPEGESEYAGIILNDWSKTMGATIQTFIEREKDALQKQFNLNPNDPHRNIDLQAEAQLMRWAAGAGLEINFKPFKGNLFDKRDKNIGDHLLRGLKEGEMGIKANAQASFAVAEGKVTTLLYYPHFAGWHATADISDFANLDFGYFRLQGDIVLFGTVGASIAIEADVGITYENGKQGLKGIPKDQGGAKARAGAAAELDVFAGAKAGLDAAGALQWLNPEGLVKQGPAKVDPHKAIPEFTNIAAINAEVAGIAGFSGKAALKIQHRDGKFIITAKVGLCLGLGGEGHLTFEVGTDTILDFFKCIAFQLKHADYAMLQDAIDERAYKAYAQIMFIAATGKELSRFVTMGVDVIDGEYDSAVQNIAREGVRAIDTIKKAMREWGLITYMPPETKGTYLMLLRQASTAPDFYTEPGYRQEAGQIVAGIMATLQTPREKHEVLQHMSLVIGEKVDVAENAAGLNSMLSGTAYANCLSDTDRRLASASPIRGRPFLRNDEPNFIFAQHGIDHHLFTA